MPEVTTQSSPANRPVGTLSPISTAPTRGSAVRAALAWLIDAGFERARFYALVKPPFRDPGDLDPDAPKLVLVERRPDNPLVVPGRLSYSIRNSLLGPDVSAWRMPMQAHGNRLGTSMTPPELMLQIRTLVEVPVLDGTEAVGVLHADRKGADPPIPAADAEALSLLGMTLGARYRRDVAGRFAGLNHPHPEQRRWITDVAASLRWAMRAGIATAFEYDWVRGELTKLTDAECPAPDFEARYRVVDPEPESYSLGERLTGAAWLSADDRYQPNFSVLEQAFVNEASRQWHENLFQAEVRTVLYEQIGHHDARYLLRFINRDDSPRLPFFADRELLHVACRRLSDELDAHQSHTVSESIRGLSVEVSGELDRAQLRAAVHKALLTINVKSWALLGTGVDGGVDVFVAEGLPFPENPTRGVSDWPASLALVLNGDEQPGGAVEEVAEHTLLLPLTERSVMTDALLVRGYTHLLCTYALVDNASVALLIPICRTQTGQPFEVARELRDHIPLRLSMLQIITVYLAQATSHRRSDLASRVGLDVVKFLQHELGTSLLSLVSEASSALQSGANAVQTCAQGGVVAHNVVWDMREARNHLLTTRAAALRIFSMAYFVAGQEESIQFDFAQVPVRDLIRDAIAQLDTRFPGSLREQFDIARYTVTLDDDVLRRLGSLCVDQDRLTYALVALLDNAVKYSITRERAQPVCIAVRARRDGRQLYVTVDNWGLPIPESRRTTIFLPFKRGGFVHSRRAIPGLGIGLFLARQVAQAHEGDVALRHSRPTLDDPLRRERQGFDTRFELWVRNDLPAGVHNWSGPGLSSPPASRP